MAGLCLPHSSRPLVEGLACGVYLRNVPLHVLCSSTGVTCSKASLLFPPVRCMHRVNKKASMSQIYSHKKSVGKHSLISMEVRFGFTCLIDYIIQKVKLSILSSLITLYELLVIDKHRAVLQAVSRKQKMLSVCKIKRYRRHHKPICLAHLLVCPPMISKICCDSALCGKAIRCKTNMMLAMQH